MNKNNVPLFALVLLLSNGIHSGGRVGIDLPPVVGEIVTANQNNLNTIVTTYNENNNESYGFYRGQYFPINSLSFVCQEKLNLDAIKDKYPSMQSRLGVVGSMYAPLDITENIQAAEIEVRPNTSSYQMQLAPDFKTNNYFNIALVFKPHAELSKLATSVRTMLAFDNITDKDEHTFSVLLGRLAKNGEVIAKEDVLKVLAGCQAVLNAVTDKPAPIKITDFYLYGEDRGMGFPLRGQAK